MHPTLRYFTYDHLPPGNLRFISARFAVLATAMYNDLPPGNQLDGCLDRLLEAKDCAVRAGLDLPDDALTVKG